MLEGVGVLLALLLQHLCPFPRYTSQTPLRSVKGEQKRNHCRGGRAHLAAQSKEQVT